MNLKELLSRNNPSKVKIYLIGIGGVGMGSLAKVLIESGYEIYGSDLLKNKMTDQLISMGAKINFFHRPKNVIGSDLIVISSAISQDNVEIVEAQKYNIPVFHRIEILSEIVKNRFSIVITGTHGKTTTTSMISEMLKNENFHPNYIIGGFSKSLKECAYWNERNEIVVIEMDESHPIFLQFDPSVLIVTGLEVDHINNYENSFKKLKHTFLKFIQKLSHFSKVILCIENSAIRSIIKNIHCQMITYGFRKDSHFRILSYEQKKNRCHFSILDPSHSIYSFQMNTPGVHNVLNATSTIILGKLFGIKEDRIQKSIKCFKGVSNRLDFLGKFILKNQDGNFCKFLLISDYGHHPNAIRFTIETIRVGWKRNRIIMIFQPHRYTRFQKFYNYFLNVLEKVDLLLITEICSSGEREISKLNVFSFHQEMKNRKKNTSFLFFKEDQLIDILKKVIQNKDIILVQSASEYDCIKICNTIKKISHPIGKYEI
ncbi:UDP-N-acetylmuramate--L-alanine ligase [Candidatus Riesia pediculicola]|uniref:UDP-N-acetylmuramate--L-alanine ligase n=1 Tax=Riesia pediculicola (strain USDA) TaxID=515618 RepID=D4G8R0_RIEPU|nr:UDP-N-acetylmuramate--L-alanine ligase [Candidatus Riesia pediculicola]ADD79556.1 UDP-N-acetylmuramate--alanine ligase [Candidatus Riesia pediculicola USDA]ARC53932.1 hypothetical protein AOE55_02125 [Candidatus Riesia pediculicola]QOJ86558.1 UDP-N-acetylmuramate--L-alanine ligase [Candidatus Riesia pediculicola]